MGVRKLPNGTYQNFCDVCELPAEGGRLVGGAHGAFCYECHQTGATHWRMMPWVKGLVKAAEKRITELEAQVKKLQERMGSGLLDELTALRLPDGSGYLKSVDGQWVPNAAPAVLKLEEVEPVLAHAQVELTEKAKDQLAKLRAGKGKGA